MFDWVIRCGSTSKKLMLTTTILNILGGSSKLSFQTSCTKVFKYTVKSAYNAVLGGSVQKYIYIRMTPLNGNCLCCFTNIISNSILYTITLYAVSTICNKTPTTMSEDYVNVICRDDQYRVAIKSHWRTLPDDEGFILLKDKISTFCGFPPLTIRSGDGVIIRSLDFISSQDTVHVVESPPQYEASGQGLDDLGLMKGVLQKVCGALGVPFTDENPSSGLRLPLASKVAELANKIEELSALTNKNVTKLEDISETVDSKSKDLDEKFNMTNSRLDEFQKSGTLMKEKISRIPVAPNLIRNSLMRDVHSSGSPTGFRLDTWRARGKINCEAVHPFVHGFTGLYAETPPEKSVTPEQSANATKEYPVFYDRYNMGPRLTRGGLSAGWQSISDGHILKLSGHRIDQYETGILLPVVSSGAASLVRFVAWIKVVKGAVSFNVDYPYWNKPGDYLKPNRRNGVCRAEDCRNQPQGWYKMDDIIGISNIVRLNGGHSFLLRCFGPTETDGLGDFEVYIALPYASLVEQSDKVTIVPFTSEW